MAKGDCYVVAGRAALNGVNSMGGNKFIGTPYVVHAEVSGQGDLEGMRYGHAFVEDDVNVYDFSNNRQIVLPKEVYYAIGEIKTVKPKHYKYTFSQACKKMAESGHFGSWDLKTECGL